MGGAVPPGKAPRAFAVLVVRIESPAALWSTAYTSVLHQPSSKGCLLKREFLYLVKRFSESPTFSVRADWAFHSHMKWDTKQRCPHARSQNAPLCISLLFHSQAAVQALGTLGSREKFMSI